MRLTQCVTVVAGASNGDGGETASGGAGGSKATVTPLAGPAACARVSSLSLQDGFDFSYNDRKGPADGYSARLVAAFSVRKAGAHYGLHQCVKLRCTRLFDIHFTHFPFIESSDYRATLLLGTGTLVVRTPAGACFVYGVAGSMQRAFGDAVAKRPHRSGDISGRRPGRGWPCPGTMLGLLSMSVPIPLLFLPIFFMSI